MHLKPLDVVEILVAPRGGLIGQQRVETDHTHLPAVQLRDDRGFGNLVEGYSADFGEQLDLKWLHTDAVRGTFSAERCRC